MREITEDEIRSTFEEKTFSRGLGYYESGHVEVAVKKGHSLTGTVTGTAPYPYTVEVEITDTIRSRCSCPVGSMCKHGVALLLQWVHDKESFVDTDYLFASLRKKSKEELLQIVRSLLEKNPALASKLAFSEKVKEKIDMEAISKRLRHVGGGFLDYYEVPSVVGELEDIKDIGDTVAKEGRLEEAVKVYLALIEWGVEAFESGVDDSNGTLGDAIYCCVEDFTKIAQKLEEEQKRDLLYRIVDIIKAEDYGLETEEMLYGIATKENMSTIEEELLKTMPTSGESFDVEYYRRRILDVLADLYRELGMQYDALRVVKEAGLKNKGDYVLMVKLLMDQDEHEKAFDLVREGLLIEDDSRDIRLGEFYFALLQLFPEERRKKVDTEEAVNAALFVLSRSFYFDPGRYAIMKDFFEKIGEHEKFIDTVKKKCEENMMIKVLLYENCIDEAAEYALSSSKVHLSVLMEVAEAARKRGKKEAAKKLTYKALKEGVTPAHGSVDELIKLAVAESDEKELKEAMDSIRNAGIARLFADALIEKNQGYAVMVLKRFIRDMKKEEILKYAANLKDTHAKEICSFWISEFINRSYVYYGDIVDILRTMKGIIPEKEWKKYISELIEENKGKKKLLEKIRAARLQ